MTNEFSLAEWRVRLEMMPRAMRALLQSSPESTLAYREAEGAWTVREVLGHLADAEIQNWRPRLEVMASDAGDRRFPSFDRERGLARYAGVPIIEALDDLSAVRAASLRRVDALALQAGDLNRTGGHPEFGTVTLDQFLATWLTHDHAHLAQVTRVLTRDTGRYVGPWSRYFSLLNDPRRS